MRGYKMVGRIVFVKRSILKAAQRLEALSNHGKDANPLDLAEFKIADCQAAQDGEGIRFWRTVWTHMMRVRQGVHCLNIVEDEDTNVAMRAADISVQNEIREMR